MSVVLFSPPASLQPGWVLGQRFVQTFLPGSGRQRSCTHPDKPRNSPPALPAQVIQKRDGQGGRKKPQLLANTQPPGRAHGGQPSGSAPSQPSPPAGSRGGPGLGEEPGGPAPAARRGPHRAAVGLSARPKPTRVASRGRYRHSYTFPEPGSRPPTSCGRRPRREPQSGAGPAPLAPAALQRGPRAATAPKAAERLSAGSPASSGRSSGELLLRRAARRRPGRGRAVAGSAVRGRLRAGPRSDKRHPLRRAPLAPAQSSPARAAAGGRLPGDARPLPRGRAGP